MKSFVLCVCLVAVVVPTLAQIHRDLREDSRYPEDRYNIDYSSYPDGHRSAQVAHGSQQRPLSIHRVDQSARHPEGRYSIDYALYPARRSFEESHYHEGENTNDFQRYPGRRSANVERSQYGVPSWLKPSWLDRFTPSMNSLLMGAKNLVAGMPFQVASTAVNQICNLAIYTGLLKPNYVPERSSLKLEAFPQDFSPYRTKKQLDRQQLEGEQQVQSQEDVEKYPNQYLTEVDENEQENQNKYVSNVTIFVTGWESATDNQDNQNTVQILARAYQKRGTYFMLYDVAKTVGSLYQWTRLNTHAVGQMLAEEIFQLVKRYNINVENIHLIGHGLGAHVAAVAGRHVFDVTGKQISQITGLDPSMVCYDEKSGFSGLRRGDAAFVDVIHTNNGVLGKKEQTGDVDFYPNGDVALPPGALDIVTAHLLAIRYYAESVIPGNEHNFLAARCNSISDYRRQKCRGQVVPMGYATPSNVRGTYFLYTNGLPPFGKNANANSN